METAFHIPLAYLVQETGPITFFLGFNIALAAIMKNGDNGLG